MTTKTQRQWHLTSQNGFSSLVARETEIPTTLTGHEVLVKIHAASLNYRDLAIAKGTRGLVTPPNITPLSDGAGAIISTGPSVTLFQPGEKVMPHMIAHFPSSAFPTMAEVCAGLGQRLDGTMREYGVFDESALVRMPANLTFEEAATLGCSGLTAWNALFGGGRTVGVGDVVLTQGTGGVSIAALQFAHAAGATVISTTSSAAKAARLSGLGATHTINYSTTPDWGSVAKSLTPHRIGVTNVIDVGGLATLPESLNAVRVEGTVTATGVLGSEAREASSLLDTVWRVCSVRGVVLGSRRQFEDMVRFVEERGVRPVVDERVFGFEEVRDAYRWVDEQRHFSKVVIKIA